MGGDSAFTLIRMLYFCEGKVVCIKSLYVKCKKSLTTIWIETGVNVTGKIPRFRVPIVLLAVSLISGFEISTRT